MSTVLRTQTMRWMGRERMMVLTPGNGRCTNCRLKYCDDGMQPVPWCTSIVNWRDGIFSHELPAIRDDENWKANG